MTIVANIGALLRIGASLALAVLLAGAAVAQQTSPRPPTPQPRDALPTGTFLNPFPENDTWRALVIGDSQAEGLVYGLVEAFATEPRLQPQKKHRPLGSLTRVDVEEDLRNLEEAMAKETHHIAIVMHGVADRGGVRLANGRRVTFGSEDWRRQYGQRLDRVMRALKRRNVAVYWVGQPVMRRQEWNDEVEAMNDLYRERAAANGVKFVDIFNESADEGGAFADRGPDIAGKVVRLRESDGVHFTGAGYRKLAFFLERELKRDMTQARNERVIPLAGDEAEQRRVNPGATGAPAASTPAALALLKGAKDGKALSPAARGLAQTSAPAAAQPVAPAGSQPGDTRADNTRISFKTQTGGREEQVTIEILRPAIPAAVVALVTRRESGDKASQVGETLTDTLSNGLMVMRSVTPSADGGARGQQRMAPTQQPFFRALVKGERLPFKPGRADDHRWPREDDLPPLPAAAQAPRPSISSPVELRPPPKGAPKVLGTPGRS